jgi:hypothetical protein
MGFRVRIEADYGGEMLQNLHPENKPSNGKAILAFLLGLENFCSWTDDKEKELKPIIDWYQKLDNASQSSLCTTCRPLLDCMWANGGDLTSYHEDEWEFYKKRYPSFTDSSFTEDMFKAMVRESQIRWKPIHEVINGVRYLLDLFKQSTPEPLEGFYDPNFSRFDFEALLVNLELLAKRGNKEVRLNFY